MSNSEKKLVAAAASLGLALSATQIAALIQYRELLLKWNKVFSLTAITDPEEMLIQHICDGLSCISHFAGAASILDVGSGMGVPGIILAICYPQAQVTAIDSNSKKTAFLTQVKIELNLTNLQVVCSRVETYHAPQLFSLITSRAFANLALFVQLTQHLLSPNGHYLALKSSLGLEEASAVVGFNCQAITLTVPFSSAQRFLLKMVRQ